MEQGKTLELGAEREDWRNHLKTFEREAIEGGDGGGCLLQENAGSFLHLLLLPAPHHCFLLLKSRRVTISEN